MERLHIVHLSTYPIDDIRVFQKACQSELSAGYQVTQIACRNNDEELQGVVIRAVKPARNRIDRMVGLSWRMFRKSLMIKGDLYQFHHPDLIVAGLLLKLAGKRVIYETRECYPDKILSMHWLPKASRFIARTAFSVYEGLTSRFWDRIIVADRHTAKGFQGRPVTILPNYPLLSPVTRKTAAGRSRRTLIYVGGLSEDRGLSVMLRTAELLRSHNVHLELMGTCPFAGAMKQIADAEAAANVTFHGNHSLAAVYDRISQADIGLLLLQPVPSYTYAGENTLKLFEYMWCEVPVVSSDFPNLREIVYRAECGKCINPCDPELAARTILDLLDHPETLARMGRNGRAAVLGAYNWPAISGSMMQAYSDVLGGLRPPADPLPLWSHPSRSSAGA